MDDDMRRRDRIRGLENVRVDDAHFSCLCLMRRLHLHHSKREVLGWPDNCLYTSGGFSANNEELRLLPLWSQNTNARHAGISARRVGAIV